MTIDGLDDENVRAILARVKTFAVIGASPKAERPSNSVMQFLIDEGYVVKPVNPGIAGKTIHDQPVYATLADVPPPVDVVDIFRDSEAVPGIVREAIAQKDRLGISTIWMQLGVINEDAAAEARAAGLTVVMDRCPHIEIPRLAFG
ncbi:CoA-binding protein [Hyphomicrobium sp.]|uniref:CoA-binding protein n=1 Tax=Hyphomicrobium sp. TaxID=82 RepID=UPI003563B1E4